MNLQGSITERQNSISHFYRKLENRFAGNSIIGALWSDMAHDISHQIGSLNALPSSFWSQLKKDPDGQLETAVRESNLQLIEVSSLKSCLDLALQFEETTILKIYAPIIRNLRKNWTNAALDFYIMVKSHVARIVRVTESFAGDPVLIQRAHLLLRGFEKAVQDPPIDVKHTIKRAPEIPMEPKKNLEDKFKKASKPAPLLAKHTKPHHSRTKPLAKKVDLPRRRARR